MDSREATIMGEIHALADAVQRDTGRYCEVSAGHHPSGTMHARVCVSDYDLGEEENFVAWDTMIDHITIDQVRDGLAQWLADKRKERAA